VRTRGVLLRFLAVPLVLLLVFAVVGCGTQEEEPDGEAVTPEPVEPVDEGPREGGTLVLAVGGNPVSLDVQMQQDWVSRQGIQYLYDALLYIDDNEDLQPRLATSWEVAEDGLTYTFYLREGVTFHDGTPFNAEAVKFNYDRMLDPDANTKQYADLEPLIESVEVVDDYTVKLHMKKVDVNFLTDVSWHAMMVSPTAVEKWGEEFAQHPVGTGPYKFEAFEPDSHIDFVRYDDYWGGRPLLDGIRVRVIPEESTRTIELEAGNVDMAYGVPPKEVKRLEEAGMTIEERTTASFQMVSINLADGPTAELPVRKAIAQAIDRQVIVDQVIYGAAEISRAGVPSVSPYYHDDVPQIDYDPDKAAQLLDEAGWVLGDDGLRYREGEPLKITILTSDAEERVLISQILAEQLSAVGIDPEIVTLEWGAYLDAMRNGDYNISYWSLAATALRATMGTANLESSQYWNVSQITRNPELAEASQRIDDILATAEETLDDAARFEMLKEFQQITQDQQLMVWLWHRKSHNAVQPWVKDYELFNYNIFWLHHAWMDKEE